ncbi:hypothetical protein [Jiangella sp. DSM 45060]|uniref:hypothetical protein n=1 Tax=Jiangella sp. DSM 45060 TaxID=1798224 RepID=UPI00087AD5BD|nr:hypothetical protein [Jiangella sp. DSM 45060]SDT51003.1 hypothetical protein SAMN04515669_4457 [Jiangella sp. DSM 45060]
MSARQREGGGLATVAVDLVDPPADDPTVHTRTAKARVVAGAPAGTNLSIIHIAAPVSQRPSIQVGSAPDRETAPWAHLTTSGLWKDVTVGGGRATLTYRLAWSPTPKRSLQRDTKVAVVYTDDVAVGDTVTHGPLSYEVLGITDTGDVATSHVDLAVRFDPSVPLTEDTP